MIDADHWINMQMNEWFQDSTLLHFVCQQNIMKSKLDVGDPIINVLWIYVHFVERSGW